MAKLIRSFEADFASDTGVQFFPAVSCQVEFFLTVRGVAGLMLVVWIRIHGKSRLLSFTTQRRQDRMFAAVQGLVCRPEVELARSDQVREGLDNHSLPLRQVPFRYTLAV